VSGGWLEPGRYYVALLLWMTLPAAIAFWLLIHPFARAWRHVGPWVAYTAAGLVMVGVGYGCWLVREPVLARRPPFQPWLAVVGVALYALAIVIERKCRKHLKLSILVGLPEVSGDGPGVLLTEGIYGTTRNPRYLDIIVAVAGWSLIVNYPAVYALTVATVAGLYVVTLLEERELRQRFGAPYEEYCATVPRFVPRSWAFLK
jgi:protein-S-isoprenylcysteine O-methyltransferase Ste14